MKRRAIFLNFVLFLFMTSLQTKGQAQDQFEKVLTEVQAYEAQHIIPRMKIQRKKMDYFLSENDQLLVLALQKEYATIQEQKNKIFSDYENKPSLLLKEWKSLQKRRKEILFQAEALAEKYNTPLLHLLKYQIKETIQHWRSDLDQIIEQYNQANANQRPLKKFGFGEFMEPAGFILWKVVEDAAADIGYDLNLANPLEVSKFLQFSIEESGLVTIRLLDQDGQFLKTVFEDYLEKGSHQVNIPEDAPTIYYCKIITKSKTEIKKYPPE